LLLGEQGIPFFLLFTKADKHSGVKADQNIAKFRKALKVWFEEVPPHILTSSETKLGCEAVLQTIGEINNNFVSPLS